MKIRQLDQSKAWITSRKHYILSNDSADALSTLASQGVVSSENGAALVVGNSYIFSLILLLKGKVKNFYVCDMDEITLNFIHFMQETLVITEHKDDFVPNLIAYINKYKPQFLHHMPAPAIRNAIEKEIQKLGELHFLSTDANFQILKQTLNEIKIEGFKANLFNKEQLNKIAQHLNRRNEKITLANFTNLGDYYHISQAGKHLSKLPFHEKANIIYSVKAKIIASISHFTKTIQSNLFSQGIDLWIRGYAKRQKVYLGFINSHNELTQEKSKMLIEAILSGNPKCIQNCYKTGFSFLTYTCLTKPDLYLVKTLLSFPIDSEELNSLLEKEKEMDGDIFKELSYYKKYAIQKTLTPLKHLPPHMEPVINTLDKYIKSRTYQRFDIPYLTWISRYFRNADLVKEKVELAITFREALSNDLSLSKENLIQKVNEFKEKNTKLEQKYHKRYVFFNKSSLNEALEQIDQSLNHLN